MFVCSSVLFIARGDSRSGNFEVFSLRVLKDRKASLSNNKGI